jgi:phospholipase/carboxylesterase
MQIIFHLLASRAILSYAVALSYPEKVQKVVAMSGYLNLEIIAEDYLKTTLVN